MVTAPLLVSEGRGINDNLNGIERIVAFDALDMKNSQIEIVQSLAKWKRIALARYGFVIGEGLYTNMNAIRRDEILDNLHSIYVDQWDWEKVIAKEQRNLDTLKAEVQKIYQAMKATERYMYEFHPVLKPILPDDFYFVTTQELENMYPTLTPKQREDAITKEYGAVFIMQIGGRLRSGQRYDFQNIQNNHLSHNVDLRYHIGLQGAARNMDMFHMQR